MVITKCRDIQVFMFVCDEREISTNLKLEGEINWKLSSENGAWKQNQIFLHVISDKCKNKKLTDTKGKSGFLIKPFSLFAKIPLKFFVKLWPFKPNFFFHFGEKRVKFLLLLESFLKLR